MKDIKFTDFLTRKVSVKDTKDMSDIQKTLIRPDINKKTPNLVVINRQVNKHR